MFAPTSPCRGAAAHFKFARAARIHIYYLLFIIFYLLFALLILAFAGS